MESVTPQLVLISVLLVLSALFSATEAALLTFGPGLMHQLLDEERRPSRLLSMWRDRPNQVLAALLIANNAVNILASAVATNFAATTLAALGVEDSGGWGVAIAVGVMTVLIVIFSEVLPKTFAKHNSRRMLPFFSVSYLFCVLFRPVAFLFQRSTGWIIEAAGGSVGRGEPTVTEEEIESMIRLGTEQGALSSDKKELYSSVIEFSQTMVKEIMVPRVDVDALSSDATLEEAVQLAVQSHFSRYPVYDGDLDSIQGLLTVRDLFEALASPPDKRPTLAVLAARRRPILVPETKRIGELLKEMQREHLQMAVVVDEFGGTAGIVTTEDVIEEIVGDIYDEHERSEPLIREDGAGRWIVHARTPIEDLEERFDIDLPEQDNYETVGGLVLAQSGRVPQVGDAVEFSGLNFEVRERMRSRILSLIVTRVGSNSAGPGSSEAGS